MPIYEYQCSRCAKVFEKIHWNSNEDELRCPYCNGDQVDRLLSTFTKTVGQSDKGISSANSCRPSSGFS